MGKSWRDFCRPIIEEVLRETKGQDEKAVKKALFDAYPFGERAMHPYKIWCDEIKRQRGLKPDPHKGQKAMAYDSAQVSMFEKEESPSG